MAQKLTPRQAAFCREYLIDLNAKQAAIRAGYSENTATQQAARLLTNVNVQAQIDKLKAKRAERTDITADRVLTELDCMGFYDPADIASHPMRGPQDIANLPERVRRAIIGWSWDKHHNFTLKLANKQGALELIGKHLGMWVERQESSGELTIRIKRE